MKFHRGNFSWLGSVIGVYLVSLSAGAMTPEAVPGEYVVKLKPSVGAMSTNQVAQALKVEVKAEVSKASHVIVVKKSIIERADAVLADLSNNPMVERAEPNYIYRASRQPNDPKLSELWGLINHGAPGVDIGAELAWDITTGSKDVIVAVIDSGVDYTIEDLKDNMWVNEAEKNGLPGVDDDGNGFVDDVHGYDFANNDADPKDDNDHGSHCAGTIGAQGDDGHGVVGVNWKVRIMALKFLTGSGGGTLAGALQAIDYGVANGAQILSNSWGGGGESATLKEAIERAEQKGVLFVAAAGNNGSNNDNRPSYPANYDVANVISVAAVDSDGGIANFSNYGKSTVHIGGPGVDVLSTTPGGLKSFSGTSMATPHVSGVAALLLANEPNLTYQEIKDRLLATAKPLASLDGKTTTGGMVHAHNALTNTIPPPDPNNPKNWDSQPAIASTPHPYDNDVVESYELSVPGAQKVAAHFSKFDTEAAPYDTVTVKDPNGKVYGVLSGNNDNSFTPVVDGDTLILEFKSDRSITKYGFDVDKMAYLGLPEEGGDSWRSKADPVSTAHPYSNFLNEEFEFTIPGASEVRLQFGQFETETGYDQVTFLDGQGNVIDTWDGNHDGELSPIAQGDTIVVRMSSDWSITRYGFDIESVSYR